MTHINFGSIWCVSRQWWRRGIPKRVKFQIQGFWVRITKWNKRCENSVIQFMLVTRHGLSLTWGCGRRPVNERANAGWHTTRGIAGQRQTKTAVAVIIQSESSRIAAVELRQAKIAAAEYSDSSEIAAVNFNVFASSKIQRLLYSLEPRVERNRSGKRESISRYAEVKAAVSSVISPNQVHLAAAIITEWRFRLSSYFPVTDKATRKTIS